MSILIGILTIVAIWMFWPILWRVGAGALLVLAVAAGIFAIAVMADQPAPEPLTESQQTERRHVAECKQLGGDVFKCLQEREQNPFAMFE